MAFVFSSPPLPVMKPCFPGDGLTPACPWKPLVNDCFDSVVHLAFAFPVKLPLSQSMSVLTFILPIFFPIPPGERASSGVGLGYHLVLYHNTCESRSVLFLKASVHCFLGWWLDDVICKIKNPCVYFVFKNLSKPATSICHFLCLPEQWLPATWPCWLLQMGAHTFITDRCFKQKTSYFPCVYFPLCWGFIIL